MKKNLYVISGATGMTGSELSHQLLKEENIVVGFDNFFASSIDTVKDLVGRDDFIFFEYDINNAEHMAVGRKFPYTFDGDGICYPGRSREFRYQFFQFHLVIPRSAFLAVG